MPILSLDVKEDPSSYTLENILESLGKTEEEVILKNTQTELRPVSLQRTREANATFIPDQIEDAVIHLKQKSLDRFKKKVERKTTKILHTYIDNKLHQKIPLQEVLRAGAYNQRNYYQNLREQKRETTQFLKKYISKTLIPFLETEVTFDKRYLNLWERKNQGRSREAEEFLGINSYEGRIKYEELFLSKPKRGTDKKNWKMLKKQIGSLSSFNQTKYKTLPFFKRLEYITDYTKHKLKHKVKFSKEKYIDSKLGASAFLLDSKGKYKAEQFLTPLNILNNANLTAEIKETIINTLEKEVFYTPKVEKKIKQRKRALLAGALLLSAGIAIHESTPLIMPYNTSLYEKISHATGNTDPNTIYYAEGSVFWETIQNKNQIDAFLSDNLNQISRINMFSEEEQALLQEISEMNLVPIGRESPYFDQLYYNPAVPPEHALDIINLTTKRDGTGITLLDSNEDVIYQIPNMHAYMEDVPDIFKDILLATEDNMFYVHPGINIPRTLEATYNYITNGNDVAGNSSITQQLAKLLFYWDSENGGARTTVRRKINEMLIAFKLEVGDTHLFDNKEDILETYFNHVYGGSTPYNIEARGLASIFQVNYDYSIDDILNNFSQESLSQESIEVQGERIRQVAHFIASLKGPTTYSVNYRKYVQAKNYFTAQDINWEDILRTNISEIPSNVTEEYEKNWNTIHNTNLLEDYLATEERIDVILNLSLSQHIINQEQFDAAQEAELHFSTPKIINEYPSYYHHFTEELRDLAPDQETYELLLNSNLTFRTHLDPIVQQQLQEQIDAVCEERNQEITGGGIVVKLKDISGTPRNYSDDRITNAIVALVGNNSERYIYNEETDSYLEGYSQIDNARRSPGSLVKMGLLAKAMEMRKSLVNSYLDSEREYHIEHLTESGETDFVEIYNPNNYGNVFSNNLISLRYALANSMNSIFLKLTQDMGVPESIERLNELMRLEDEERLDPVLSNAIGSQGVRAINLINMPLTIANMGTYMEPTTISSISSLENEYQTERIQERAMDEAVAYETNYAAAGTVMNGTLYNARYLGCDYRLFGKTGTSQNHADAKAITWSYDYLTYVGFNQFDSNEAIPIKTDEAGNDLYDWRGNPVRMNGSHEPATIAGNMIQLTNEIHDVANKHLYDEIPEDIIFANVADSIIPIRKGELNYSIERTFNLTYNDDWSLIIEDVQMPFY